MCFYYRQSIEAKRLINRFNAQIKRDLEELYRTGDLEGFKFPKAPVVPNIKPRQLELFDWGLIPHWSRDNDIRKYTLNARIETINEKPSFRNSVQNRCLILADGFYEWQWLDPKGYKKQKYLITKKDADDGLFAMGGLWSRWKNPQTGEVVESYTILTQPANQLMEEIHNSKKRMPVILNRDIENDWLYGKIKIDEIPDVDLNAEQVDKKVEE